MAARVAPDGTVLDTGAIIGSADAHNDYYPDIAFDGNRCLVVWYHSYYPPHGIFGRFINSLALPEDTIIHVALTQTHIDNLPKLDYGPGEYFVVWADLRPGQTDYDIFGQLVSPQGELIGSLITVATGAQEQTRPDVAFDGRAFLVVWTESGPVMGQWVATDGQLSGSAFAVSDTSPNPRNCARLCRGSTNMLVVWSELLGAHTDIYGSLVPVSGIAETPGCRLPPALNPASVARTLPRLTDPCVRIFDCMGRGLKSPAVRAGVYFLAEPGARTAKLVIQ